MRILDFFRHDLSQGLRNLWRFFPVVWGFRPYDSWYLLDIFATALQEMYTDVERHGHEEEDAKSQKLQAMARCLELLTHLLLDCDYYYVLAENVLRQTFSSHENDVFIHIPGSKQFELRDNRTPEEQERDKNLLEYAWQLQKQDWIELWELILGTTAVPGSNLQTWGD